MASSIRQATKADVGVLAHLVLVWDAELPPHLRTLNGDAAYAETVMRHITSSIDYYTYVIESNLEVEGAFTISRIQGIFSPRPYGILNLVVYPSKRGGRLLGLKLIHKAIEVAREQGLAWLEANPWADAHGMQYVLERLGFMEATRGYALRLGERL